MSTAVGRTARYTRAWYTGRTDVVTEELRLDRDGTTIPATLFHPRRDALDLPAWVVVHGLTRSGRAHPQLVRFTRAMASAGLACIVPEVPEWTRLDMAPGLTAPTIAAALDGLRSTGIVRQARVGALGFSFGAPHVFAAATHPRLSDAIAGVCAFGGYCGLEPTIRFMMTGRHEWAGRIHATRPDPYGRWIVAANYLTAAPEHADAHDVAQALRSLARHAGDVGAASWDPRYRPVMDALRVEVAESRRPLFDLLVSTEAPVPDDPRALALAESLSSAARASDPDVDAGAALGRFEGAAHVLHGRTDHLIPFTESHRLARALSAATTRLTITRLFGHSTEDPFPVLRAMREVPKFARAITAVLGTV